MSFPLINNYVCNSRQVQASCEVRGKNDTMYSGVATRERPKAIKYIFRPT